MVQIDATKISPDIVNGKLYFYEGISGGLTEQI